ncbi:MAG: hypothetical protein P4L62_00900 [Candidatus Pacebacteria bacterium]|nr:hypothetical protein [Candidatus Paceibacterota bacterium]
MTDDNPAKRLRRKESRLRELTECKKRNILALFILVIFARLFFSVLFGDSAYAERPNSSVHPRPEIIDPMERIGRSSLPGYPVEKICQVHSGFLEAGNIDRENEKNKEKEVALQDLLAGYPIERMAPYIAKQDKTVAAFLIGIARKESTWGVHAPRLDGRDCYNYWGYKGSYNLVDGYSCFDSPEQAVAVVGGRLQTLVSQNLDTPARMAVWKCGGQCASDSGVAGWIATVSGYFYKLNS